MVEINDWVNIAIVFPPLWPGFIAMTMKHFNKMAPVFENAGWCGFLKSVVIVFGYVRIPLEFSISSSINGPTGFVLLPAKVSLIHFHIISSHILILASSSSATAGFKDTAAMDPNALNAL